MKRILFSALVFCLAATTVFAQKKIKDTGYVKYEITDIQSEDAMASMLKGSTMETFMGKGQSRMSMNMMGGMMEINTYTGKDGNTVTLMSMMGNKMKTVMSEEDVKKAQKDAKTPKDMKFTYNKRKTKTIAGYKCHQVTTESDGGTITLYVTKKIALTPSVGGQSGINFKGLEGYPLEFTVTQPGMEITFSAKEVSGKVSKSAFEYDDAGYKEVSPEELGGMGGGLGL